MTFPIGERMIDMIFHNVQTGVPGSAWTHVLENLRTIPTFNFESVDTFIDLVTMVYSHLFLRVVTYL